MLKTTRSREIFPFEFRLEAEDGGTTDKNVSRIDRIMYHAYDVKWECHTKPTNVTLVICLGRNARQTSLPAYPPPVLVLHPPFVVETTQTGKGSSSTGSKSTGSLAAKSEKGTPKKKLKRSSDCKVVLAGNRADVGTLVAQDFHENGIFTGEVVGVFVAGKLPLWRIRSVMYESVSVSVCFLMLCSQPLLLYEQAIRLDMTTTPIYNTFALNWSGWV